MLLLEEQETNKVTEISEKKNGADKGMNILKKKSISVGLRYKLRSSLSLTSRIFYCRTLKTKIPDPSNLPRKHCNRTEDKFQLRGIWDS